MKLAATSAPLLFFLFQLLCLILYGSLEKSETEEEETFPKSSRSYDEESANSSYANNSHSSFLASPPIIGVCGNAAFVSH